MNERAQHNLNALQVSQEAVDQYLETVSDRSRGHYRYSLRMFYSWLPDDKRVRSGDLEKWRDYLQEEGYAESTINARLSACNNLVDFLGRRDLQVMRLKLTENEQPELDRSEYYSLLNTAKEQGRDTEYILMRLFASVGISLEDVQSLTVEGIEDLEMPDFMKKELVDYAARHGLSSGLLFRTRSGKPIDRAAIRSRINRLAQPSGVDGIKANPRCLQRLYRTTMASIRADAEFMIRNTYRQMLEEEYEDIDWRRSRRAGRRK